MALEGKETTEQGNNQFGQWMLRDKAQPLFPDAKHRFAHKLTRILALLPAQYLTTPAPHAVPCHIT